MNFYEKIEEISKTKSIPSELTEMVEEYEAVKEAVEETEQEQSAHAKFSEEYNELEEEISGMEDQLEEIEQRINLYVDRWGSLGQTQHVARTPVAKQQEKKSGGVGWLLFGGVVLVLTFGAVNAFKK